MNGNRRYFSADGPKRPRKPTFCFECGAMILRPASTVTIPVCSECNPNLHDRTDAKQVGRHPAPYNNWYEEGCNDNAAKIYESA
jgi:hypothetical protein